MKIVRNFYSVDDRKALILQHISFRFCSSLIIYNNHITDNNICLCGEIESAEHFLLISLNYAEIRNKKQHVGKVGGMAYTILKPFSKDVIYSVELPTEIY